MTEKRDERYDRFGVSEANGLIYLKPEDVEKYRQSLKKTKRPS